MSLRREGSRVITVDGRCYRWVAVYAKVTWCSAACPLHLTVQQDGGRGVRKVVATCSLLKGQASDPTEGVVGCRCDR
jgi:hypothetical protein